MLTAEFDGGSNPRLNRFIAGELKISELVILHGLRHDIPNEAPDRVADPLLDFLRKVAWPSRFLDSRLRMRISGYVHALPPHSRGLKARIGETWRSAHDELHRFLEEHAAVIGQMVELAHVIRARHVVALH